MNNKGNLTDERPSTAARHHRHRFRQWLLALGTGNGWLCIGNPHLGSPGLRTRYYGRESAEYHLLSRHCFYHSGHLGNGAVAALLGRGSQPCGHRRDGWCVDSPVVADSAYRSGRSERCLVVGIGGTCSLPLL